MARQTIEGYAIICPKFLGKGFDVVGIGQMTCEAWADASQKSTGGRVPTRDMYKEYPKMKCVPAKITVNFN